VRFFGGRIQRREASRRIRTIDTGHLLRMGANYAYDPTPMLDEMHRAGHEIVENR